jgi:uncharacterized damage-inducible protein DinB
MPNIIESIRNEYLRYKSLAEGAIDQLPDGELSASDGDASNSIAAICWHISGNLQSRFTDFLTADGEKPWRNREEEFARRTVTRTELLEKWERGWAVLLSALDELSDGQLAQEVIIRGQPMQVHEALHRSLAHLSYHAGQIVYVAKAKRGRDWKSLSIPPGGSATYNRNPTLERGPARG